MKTFTDLKKINEMKGNPDRYQYNGLVKHEEELYAIIDDLEEQVVNHVHLEAWEE